jgi:predicted nucleotidyltransferase
MRLTEKEIVTIRETIRGIDQAADIYLFGSRADDRRRGGDIDLLIASDKLTADDRRKIRLQLYDRLGEQKIDIVLARNASEAFVRIAKEDGVRL